ncbi:MAG: gamma-glutamyl-gamma-aminobutyrate hydrolase family protein [bacterium]
MTQTIEPPIIGITTYGRNESGRFDIPAEYVDAVRVAGGLPVLLPPGETDINQILRFVDGLIFAGGGDIAPNFYGGTSHPAISRVDVERDRFELALAQDALNDSKPVLGICRGCQLLNVSAGGNLVAHVPDKFNNQVAHATDSGEATAHPVQIVPESRLAKIMGETKATVVSKHHQALDAVAPGWRAVAKAPDGLVEAIEHQKHPWMVAVLWHPESSQNDPSHQRLFAALVQTARNSQV